MPDAEYIVLKTFFCEHNIIWDIAHTPFPMEAVPIFP